MRNKQSYTYGFCCFFFFFKKNGKKFSSLRSLQVHIFIYVLCIHYIIQSVLCSVALPFHSCGFMDAVFRPRVLRTMYYCNFQAILNIILFSTACLSYVFWLLMLLLISLKYSPDFSSHRWMDVSFLCMGVESVSPAVLRVCWW